MIQVPEWAMVMAFYALYPLFIAIILGAIGIIAEFIAIKASWTTRALSFAGRVFRGAKFALAGYFGLSALAYVFLLKAIHAWPF